MYVGEREFNNEILPCREAIQESIASMMVDNRTRMEEILSVLKGIDAVIGGEAETTKQMQDKVGCLTEEVSYQRELTIEILNTAVKIKAILGG